MKSLLIYLCGVFTPLAVALAGMLLRRFNDYRDMQRMKERLKKDGTP